MKPRPYRGVLPTLGERVYIDPMATLVGDVVLGDDVSLWPGVVVRGDVNFIRVGARTNIQDGTVVHVSHDGPHAKLGGFATVIGEDVTIGHKAVVHACRIADACLIGMGAIVLDGAWIGADSIVAAGSLVTGGFVCPPGSMVMGYPAKVTRALTPDERGTGRRLAEKYVEVARAHAARQAAATRSAS